jgi:hypothetical protein
MTVTVTLSYSRTTIWPAHGRCFSLYVCICSMYVCSIMQLQLVIYVGNCDKCPMPFELLCTKYE